MYLRSAVAVLVLALMIGTLPIGLSRLNAPVLATQAQAAELAGLPDAPAANQISLQKIGRFQPADAQLDESASEIVAFDSDTNYMYITNGQEDRIDVVDITNPISPTAVSQIDISPFGAGLNSVAVQNGIIAIAIEGPNTDSPGTVWLGNNTGTVTNTVTVGVLPDMVTFSPNGNYVLSANEGEPNEAYTVDPEGSISVINITAGIAGATVQNATFESFNAGEANDITGTDVRIFGRIDTTEPPDGVGDVDSTVAQDLEPEYIAVSPDSTTAYVTLQENNALAIVDIAPATVSAVLPLGFKDHSQPGAGMDANDQDDAANIAPLPANILGMYQPDAIVSYEVDGQVYLVTANEGDAREYDTVDEEARASSLTLDPTNFPGGATPAFARLNVTNTLGDGGDGTFETLYAFGARSFTIWNATTGAVVADSGDDIEQRTAAAFPGNFNANNDDNGIDGRSDNKGPEPEALDIGMINGRYYAFVGLERIGGIMIYDITDPANPTYVSYFNDRAFTGDEPTLAEDSGPEGIKFVPAEDSPNGQPLLLVSFEVTGSTSIYQIQLNNADANLDGAGTLTLLHNNDGESNLLPDSRTVGSDAGFSNPMTETLTIGSVAAFKTVTDREIADARNRGNAVVNVYAGDAFLAGAELQCTLLNPTGPFYDAVAQRQIPYTAHILGNHEFDYGPAFLARFINAFGGNQPFLSSNLDFEPNADLGPLATSAVLVQPLAADGIIGGSMIYTDTQSGQRFGIVGLTTPLLANISSPGDVVVESSNITETAAIAQAAIDNLYDTLGVRKIILVSHLQDIDNDLELVSRMRRVDIAVAGGGDELLTNAAISDTLELLPGDEPGEDSAGNPLSYPLIQQDADERNVYVVTSGGNYNYLGRLDVTFDAAGEIASVDNDLSFPRRVVVANEVATNVGIADAVTPDPGLVSSVQTPVQACLTDLENTAVARTEVTLESSRNAVRGRESNLGNLVTDGYLFMYDQYAENSSLSARDAENIVVALTNGGGIRQNAGDTIEGIISRRTTIDILPFDNFITVVSDVTPAQMKEILENAAAPGSGRFAQLAGIRVLYDTAKPVGSRVLSATLEQGNTPLIRNGQVVADAPNVKVVTNSFVARGGDSYATFEGILQSRKVNLQDNNGTAIAYEQALREYLQSFPVGGDPALPTIPASDTRYQEGGEGRIEILTRQQLLPLIYAP